MHIKKGFDYRAESDSEFVSKEQINESFKIPLNGRHEKEKPLWTHNRIEEAFEQFQLTSVLKVQKTNKQYNYGKKYDLM